MTTSGPTATDPVVIPTDHGPFRVRAWEFPDGATHLSATALDRDGFPLDAGSPAPYVRVHSECLTGDVLGSHRCDCGPQLAAAMDFLAEHGGTLIYLRGHEGRGIGLANKLRAYALQERGLDTVDANLALGLPEDARDYRQAAEILTGLDMDAIRLVTNNPTKTEALRGLGIEVREVEPDEIPPRPENARYLATKRDRMRHRLVSDFTDLLGQ